MAEEKTVAAQGAQATKSSLLGIMQEQASKVWAGESHKCKLIRCSAYTRGVGGGEPSPNDPSRSMCIFEIEGNQVPRVVFDNAFVGGKRPYLPEGGIDCTLTIAPQNYVNDAGEEVNTVQVVSVDFDINKLPIASQAALIGAPIMLGR